MINIRVSYNTSRDVKVYLNSMYKFKWLKHGWDNIKEELLNIYPEEFKIALKSTPNKLEAEKVIRNYLKNKYRGKRLGFRKVARILEETWLQQGMEIEKQLVGLYQQKIPFTEISIYLTTAPICPYNFDKREIMVTCRQPVDAQIGILKHELNHFMFYYYYSNLQKELSKEKFESLKEALAILTNPEEQGYPVQQKLRQWLKKQQGTIPEIIQKGKWKKYL